MHVYVKRHLFGVMLYVFHGGFTAAFSFLMFENCFPGFFTGNFILFTYDVVTAGRLDAEAMLKLYAVLWAFIGGGIGSIVFNIYCKRCLPPHVVLSKMATVETLLMLIFAVFGIIYQNYFPLKSNTYIFLLSTPVFFSGGWQFQTVSNWNKIPLRTNMMSGNIMSLSATLFSAIWMRIQGEHRTLAGEFYNNLRRTAIVMCFALIFVLGAAAAFVIVPKIEFYAGIIMTFTCFLTVLTGYDDNV